jgi:hypothetical protein
MLIDTDILINFLQGKPRARDFLTALPADIMSCCSVVTVAELFAGMRESEREKTAELTNSLVVLPITEEIAELAGTFKREAKGFNLELDDCFIAATAIIEGTELATRNTRHYPMPQVKLMVANY